MKEEEGRGGDLIYPSHGEALSAEEEERTVEPGISTPGRAHSEFRFALFEALDFLRQSLQLLLLLGNKVFGKVTYTRRVSRSNNYRSTRKTTYP